jgi:hypothetical protein
VSTADEWITPAQAAEVMSERAGYVVTQDDIRQLKRLGRIKQVRKIGERMALYNLEEIRTVTPPKKRNPKPYTPREQEAA